MPKERTLYSAVYANNPDKVKDLLEAGADPNELSTYDNPPLHRACYRGYTKIARLLVEYGADVNVKDKRGYSPLHWACICDYAGIARMLLEAGADVNAKDVMMRSVPLHYACKGQTANVRTVKALIAAGADVNVKDNTGRTPLDLATKIPLDNRHREEILDLFREYAPEQYFTAYCAAGPGGP